MSDPIKAALEAAAWAQCEARARVNECDSARCPRREPCPWCAQGAAAAVAVFLRAAPDVIPLGKDMQVSLSRTTRVLLAQEVERAAREGGG